MLHGMLYGGDEIGALVFDPGHHSFRIGYAQEDLPKFDIPSVIGVAPATHIPEDEEKLPVGNVTQSGEKKHTLDYYVDVTSLHHLKPNKEIETYMKDGQIDNFELFEKVMDYCYSKIIRSPSEHHPTLFTESVWNSRASREKLAELMFEKYNAPAFFIVKNAVLSAYANGRYTALMVDAGASHTSAVPVIDGYAIVHAATRSSIGGDHLTNQAKQMLNNLNIQMLPLYSIQSKDVIRERERPRYTQHVLPAGLTQSFQDYMLKRQYEDFCHNIIQISESPYDERSGIAVPGVHYEFPGGYHQDFGVERLRLGETMFEHANSPAQLVLSSASMCEAEVRPALLGCVVGVGGSSLCTGWGDRLAKELSQRAPPSHRIKFHTLGPTNERRFSAWIGGSILASIGSFQQMWVSSQEYEEGGKTQLERKCA